MPPNAPRVLALDDATTNDATVTRIIGVRGVVASGTGAVQSTGVVTIELESIPLVAGKWFSRVFVDIHGRVVNGVEGSEQDFNPDNFIWNQTGEVQNASFSVVAGNVQNLQVQNLTLGTPLLVSYGGTGTSTASQGYVFIGPASTPSGSPSFRRLVAQDLPSDIPNYIWNNPITQQSASFNISGLGSVSAVELNSESSPSTTTNKLYRIGSVLHWNGTPVGSTYTLPIATTTILGGVKIGDGLSIAPDGTLSASSVTAVALNDLTDVVVSTPAEDQVLVYQDGTWANVAVSSIPTLESYIESKVQEMLDAQLVTAIANYVNSIKGQPNGVASLGATGKVPDAQLPPSATGGGDKEFVYRQVTPAFVWNVVHNLGTYPTVNCLDDTVFPYVEFEGKVDYVDLNTLTVTFNELSLGIAVCR